MGKWVISTYLKRSSDTWFAIKSPNESRIASMDKERLIDSKKFKFLLLLGKIVKMYISESENMCKSAIFNR